MNKIKGLPTAKQWQKMLEEYERGRRNDEGDANKSV